MMTLKKTLLAYLRLSRLQTAAVTAVTPLIGSLLMGQQDIMVLSLLFLIGFFYHIYGFVLNEYIDIEIDKKSIDLQTKPLVSNQINKRSAVVLSLSAAACCCLLTLYFYPAIQPLAFLLLALFLGGVYDVLGKRIPGSDFILGLSFFFMCLMGASTVSDTFTTVTYIVCSIYFIHIVFNNAVEGGLKDVDHDTTAGAKTLAARLGVRIQDNKLSITTSFALFSWTVKMIFIGLIVSLWFQPETKISFSFENTVQITLLVFFVSIVFVTMQSFLSTTTFERTRLKRLFSIHEISSYFLLVLSLSPLIGLPPTLFLLFFPFLWFILFNVILYGNALQPQV
jgi:4-hydroxybenzoate polyprenyltransferase